MGHEFQTDFLAVLAEDGTVQLPVEIRDRWGLRAGDQLEFFQDYAGRWLIRPLNAGPLDFLECLPPRAKRPDVTSDEDALEKALDERRARASETKAAE
jgi:bifunctional DNA-binding transcriptional regulator/antitoxin component of YhaV-PrlF toxin-antitoxin module